MAKGLRHFQLKRWNVKFLLHLHEKHSYLCDTRTKLNHKMRGKGMDFPQPQILKRTGLKVGRLGLGAGYGAPATTYEEAFERG